MISINLMLHAHILTQLPVLMRLRITKVLCSSLVTSVQILILICHIEVDIRINLPGTDDSSWSLHALCVAARVFSRFSSFLLQSKDMHVQSSLYIHFMTVKISYQQLCIRLEKFMVSKKGILPTYIPTCLHSSV